MGAANREQRDNSIRVDTARLDQVLNLSGEIGLTKNRLNALRSDIPTAAATPKPCTPSTWRVSQLDLLVSDLQNAVMKTRMQPIGRLFQKYPRIARDLARNLGKDVELVLAGEETEIDKTMIEDLSDPIIHLIRNAVDHGVEEPGRSRQRQARRSPSRLEARQEGDHIVIPGGRRRSRHERRAAARQGSRRASSPTRKPTPWTSARATTWCSCPASRWPARSPDVSGRGVGMDVVRTNIQKLNGSIDIRSSLGKGTTFIISLPLTLAILPVLLVRSATSPSRCRCRWSARSSRSSRPRSRRWAAATMVVRGEVLPIMPCPPCWAGTRSRPPSTAC